MADARTVLRRVFREQGFDDVGASPHSWRCQYPDRYPNECSCLDEMVAAILGAGFILAPTCPECQAGKHDSCSDLAAGPDGEPTACWCSHA
jgi:hypothetical protein